MFTVTSSSDFHMCLCFMQRTEDSSSSKQHVDSLPSLGRGKTAHSTCPMQRLKFSSRTLQGNHPQRKRDQRNKLLRVHLLRSAPRSLIVKAEPKKAEDSGLPLGHEAKGGLMSFLYPHDSPEDHLFPAARVVLGNFWHLMQMEVIPVVSQGRGSEEVLRSGTEIEIQGQNTGKPTLAAGGLKYRAVQLAQTQFL